MRASSFVPLAELPSADAATWQPDVQRDAQRDASASRTRFAPRAARLPVGAFRPRGYRPLRLLIGVTGLLIALRIAPVIAGVETIGGGSSVSVGLGDSLPLSLAISLAISAYAALTASRLLAFAASSILQRGWPRVERLAVVASDVPPEFAEDFGSYGSQLAGVIVPPNGRRSVGVGSGRRGSAPISNGGSSSGFAPGKKVLGDTDQLAAIVNRCRIDRLIFLDEGLERSVVDDGLAVARRMGIRAAFSLAPVADTSQMQLSEYCGRPVLEIRPSAFAQPRDVVKRVFDIVAGSALLLLSSPLLILLAVMVKLSGPGPVLHNGLRVGKGGRYFTLYKFRSMYDESGGRSAVESRNEKKGHLFKIRNDPRITPVGAFLRRYSLDELPQLFNVLAGHMSLVGPRPLPAEDLEPDGQSRAFRTWARERSDVLPGITGLWQVSGRSSLPFEDMVELDLDYIRRWSFALDLRVLLETPRAVLSGRGAY